jgi:glycosyltransferase involved in cell wall biosynthesis
LIQQLVTEINLGSDVHFLGEQDQLEPLFFCADLFVLPSEQESFGLTALEAMNCGVPVIGADIGGLPEVIVHGETGYLFPVGDIANMSAKAVELLSDPAGHELFKARARRRAEQFFDADRIIPQYEAFYEEVLNS